MRPDLVRRLILQHALLSDDDQQPELLSARVGMLEIDQSRS
jgi:hypothetical protein